MTNLNFDRMCARQDLKNAQATLANMKAALPTAKGAERDYILRAIPTTERQIEIYRDRLAWG